MLFSRQFCKKETPTPTFNSCEFCKFFTFFNQKRFQKLFLLMSLMLVSKKDLTFSFFFFEVCLRQIREYFDGAFYQSFSCTFPANIHLDEDVLKTSWRRLSSLSSEDVLKTSSRCLDQDEYVRLSLTSSEDVKTNIFVLAIGLQDVLENVKLLRWRRVEDVFKTCLQGVFKTSWRLTNVCWVVFSALS